MRDVAWDKEKCPLPVLTSVHIKRVKKYEHPYTIKRREEEPRFFEVWQNRFLIRFLIFMKKDTVVDYKKLL